MFRMHIACIISIKSACYTDIEGTQGKCQDLVSGEAHPHGFSGNIPIADGNKCPSHLCAEHVFCGQQQEGGDCKHKVIKFLIRIKGITEDLDGGN